ncbi:MAG: hypothetical protein LC797_09460 [Chloroflexi bacterium]|nr:hypothetical protein [Chloroflexota bacterium]
MDRRSTSPRLPRSGNAALAAGAIVQAALGLQFLFAGLSKALNPNYTQQFSGYLQGMPGSTSGPLAALIQALIVPHLEPAAQVAKFTELGAGAVLLVTAIEVVRRRFSGPLGAEHGYEPLVALLSATAALAVAGLSATIYLIQGGRLPGVNPAAAFSAPIAVELLVVPLALGVAWLEFGRFRALCGPRLTAAP